MSLNDQNNYCQSKIQRLDAMQDQILHQQKGKLLFMSLMDDMKKFSDKKIERQEIFMKCLESWWDHNKLVASYLMGRLLPQAGKIIDNHSLYNAIELYLTSEKNLSITQAINILLNEDIAPSYKNKYKEFLTLQSID